MAEGPVGRAFPLGTARVEVIEVELEVPDPLRFEAGAERAAAIEAAAEVSSSFSKRRDKSSIFCAIAVRDAETSGEPAECIGVDISVVRVGSSRRGGTRG